METLAVVIAIVAMLLWLRTEANTDRRQINANLDLTRNESIGRTDALRAETNALVNAIRQDVQAIHMEMKDFHNRLCAIEERRK